MQVHHPTTRIIYIADGLPKNRAPTVLELRILECKPCFVYIISTCYPYTLILTQIDFLGFRNNHSHHDHFLLNFHHIPLHDSDSPLGQAGYFQNAIADLLTGGSLNYGPAMSLPGKFVGTTVMLGCSKVELLA